MKLAGTEFAADNARTRQKICDAMSTDAKTLLPVERHDAAPAGDLPLFRFRLRQLLLFVTLACLLLTAITFSSGLTALVIILATLVISFHLLSTAIGSQLRTHADQSIALNRLSHEHAASAEHAVVSPIQPAGQRLAWAGHGIPLPWMPRLVAAISLFGGLLGAIVLALTVDHRNSIAGIAVGAISMGIVAGWFAFLGYSFFSVVRDGLKQAIDDERRNSTR